MKICLVVMLSILVLVGMLCGSASAAAPAGTCPKLTGKYYVDIEAISVSGVSSGSAFATNFHVAHTASIMGAGLFAGTPYWCAMDDEDEESRCTTNPDLIDVNSLIAKTAARSECGEIDNICNLVNAKVFIWHGLLDDVVKPGVSDKTKEYYQYFCSDIKADFITAEHGQPTVDYGVACDDLANPWIMRCEYDGAFQALNHIYGGDLQQPSGDEELNGTFTDFDQSDFTSSSNSFDTTGFIYIPAACETGEIACRLHAVFHGCLQGRWFLGNDFALNTGYLQVAELNNIIVLFPQIRPLAAVGNPNGCWDWWGYDSDDYASKSGVQIIAIKAMLDHIAGM